MARITHIAALPLLTPYLQLLRESVEGGWDDYRTRYGAELRSVHNSITRANIVHDHIMHRLRHLAVPGSGMTVISQTHLSLLSVSQGSAFIRIKKMNAAGISRTYPTRHARRFALQLPLDGIPDVPRFDAGYVLDSLETRIVNIFVSQPERLGSVSWKIDVLEATGGKAEGTATMFPLVPTGPPKQTLAPSPIKIKPGVNPKPAKAGGWDDSDAG